MVKPSLLKSGDTVAIVAPGRKIKHEDIDSAIRLFESWGLNVIVGENLFSEGHPYLSGSDDARREDIQSALNNNSIKCVVCARGGYGTTRILDQLDFSALQNNPKWIVGFSDVTALHLQLFKLGIESIHATMPVLFSKPDSKDSVESLKEILFKGKSTLHADYTIHNRLGKGEGQVIGGNLSLIADSLGTRSEPDTTGKILVIEEIDEYRYKVDRMLTQLSRAGKLEVLSGLIVGHMTNIQDSEVSFSTDIEGIVNDAVNRFKYPVAFGFPTGHENPNLAWIHGQVARLDVSVKGSSLTPLK